MSFDVSDGNEFLRDANDSPLSRPANAHPSNQSALDQAKAADVENAEIEHNAFMDELRTIGKNITDNEVLFGLALKALMICESR